MAALMAGDLEKPEQKFGQVRAFSPDGTKPDGTKLVSSTLLGLKVVAALR